MSDNKQNLVVYVDTSYLCMMPKEQVANWNRLLLLSKEEHAEIHISRVAVEEYRTQHRDKLIAEIEKTKTKLRSLQKEWRSNVISKSLGEPVDTEIFPSEDKIEEQSHEMIKNLVEVHKVKILEPKPHHAANIWENYFSWKEPFRNASLSDRGERNIRDNRRKDIPDAWIYEAALDIPNDQTRLLCLCKDENLANALRKKVPDVFGDAAEILKILETPVADSESNVPLAPTSPSVLSESTLPINSDSNAEPPDVGLAIKKLQDSEKLLQIRILGYVNWFAPVAKHDLANLLQEKGHAAQVINNASERLALSGLITDTGNHYLPGNKAVCEQAASSVMSEILETLDK